MSFFGLFILSLFATYLLIILTALHLLRRNKAKRINLPGKEKLSFNAITPKYPLLEVISVRKSFDTPVLKGVSFRVNPGQTLGILGQSGSGKSVLLKLIAGFLKPDSGEIIYRGVGIRHFKEDKLLNLRKEVSYVFQSGAIFDFFNVRENVAFPLLERGELSENEINHRVDYLLDAVEMEGMGHLRVNELGVGAKKQVAIARALATRPNLILYDEPTTGTDPLIGKSISALIRKLSIQEQLTSVVVTHDMKCLETVSDRIILLKDGIIHFSGVAEDFKTSEDAFVTAFREGRLFNEAPPVNIV
jgi:ABC-type transporter Mla maintaining outer membrane lipid asymmetry ATPase subunit MlaF